MNASTKFWDKTAEKYSRSRIADEAAYRRKLLETRNYFKSDMHVLEFGCGTGTTAVHHAPHVQHIDALDTSEKMLEIGRTRARDAEVQNIKFTRASLFEFNATAASYDAVLGLSILHLLADWQAHIAEAARVLKPGGIFVSSTACLAKSPLRFAKLFAPIGKVVGLMPDVFILQEAGLARTISEAGFEIETQWQHGMQDTTVFIIARKREDA